MSRKIIQLSAYEKNEEYNQALAEIRSKLSDVEDDLFDACVQLAVLGKWKKWSDEQPVGSTVYFDGDMLKESGDENITILIQLLDYIADRNTKLKYKPGISPKQNTKSSK